MFFIKPDGSGGELHLCRACAVARGFASAGEGLGARLDSLLNDGAGTSAESCPACGWTAELIRTSGRLGCTDCIKTLRRDILSALKRSGAHGPYEGKVPLRARAAEPDPESRAALSDSLELAIRAEDFEAAASLRDRLRALSGRRLP